MSQSVASSSNHLPIDIIDILNSSNINVIDSLDDDIINLGDDFPRFLTDGITPCKYYTHSSIDKIFNSSDNTSINTSININNSLKTIHVNIRGIENNYLNFVTFLKSFSFNFDIICLSEAHLDNNKSYLDTDRFDIEGYTQYKIFSTISYGGCIIYVRNPIKSNILSNLTGSNSIADYLYVSLDLPGSRKQVVICLYYRHNKRGKEVIGNFIEHLDNHLSSSCLRNKKVILLGDMNIDLCNISINNDIELYYNSIISHNLESHINYPTRVQFGTDNISVRSATIIDHIFSNLSEYNCISGNIVYPDSDHFANFLCVSNILDHNTLRSSYTNTIYKRNYTNINVDNLVHDFNQLDWDSDVLNNDITIDDSTSNLIRNLSSLCDEHAPLKHVPYRKVKYIDKPWITRDILPYIIAKNKMAKVKNSNPSGFRKVKNYVTGLIRRRHADYLNKYFTEHRNNSKKVWDGIRTALEWNNSKSSSINSVKDTEGNTLTDSKLMADSFAKYFKNIPHKCVTKIPKGLGKPGYLSYMPGANPSSMVLYDTDGSEICEIIKDIHEIIRGIHETRKEIYEILEDIYIYIY